MKFFITNDTGRKLALFEYKEGTDVCDDCNSIVIQKGSFMSKHTVCLNRWYDCKWIDDAREIAISKGIVEDFDDDFYVFVKELSCESPIKAASVVLGHIETDAWDIIVNEEGKTLREIFR
ncbi:MAG: DUF4357 domain-containing protein [Candidatus Izimaplasma sp.]|nr:DUF4357 domain-containing protein [Candidatus Izimaplasma bacterium]